MRAMTKKQQDRIARHALVRIIGEMSRDRQPIRRYEVVEPATGDRFGNHTLSEAAARGRLMTRNWNYKKVFVVEERQP